MHFWTSPCALHASPSFVDLLNLIILGEDQIKSKMQFVNFSIFCSFQVLHVRYTQIFPPAWRSWILTSLYKSLSYIIVHHYTNRYRTLSYIIIQILQKWPTRCNCVGKCINALFLKCSTCFERYYRSKHVVQLRNNGLIHFPTHLYLVGHFCKVSPSIVLTYPLSVQTMDFSHGLGTAKKDLPSCQDFRIIQETDTAVYTQPFKITASIKNSCCLHERRGQLSLRA
jgi:hypothetical protein